MEQNFFSKWRWKRLAFLGLLGGSLVAITSCDVSSNRETVFKDGANGIIAQAALFSKCFPSGEPTDYERKIKTDCQNAEVTKEGAEAIVSSKKISPLLSDYEKATKRKDRHRIAKEIELELSKIQSPELDKSYKKMIILDNLIRLNEIPLIEEYIGTIANLPSNNLDKYNALLKRYKEKYPDNKLISEKLFHIQAHFNKISTLIDELNIIFASENLIENRFGDLTEVLYQLETLSPTSSNKLSEAKRILKQLDEKVEIEIVGVHCLVHPTVVQEFHRIEYTQEEMIELDISEDNRPKVVSRYIDDDENYYCKSIDTDIPDWDFHNGSVDGYSPGEMWYESIYFWHEAELSIKVNGRKQGESTFLEIDDELAEELLMKKISPSKTLLYGVKHVGNFSAEMRVRYNSGNKNNFTLSNTNQNILLREYSLYFGDNGYQIVETNGS